MVQAAVDGGDAREPALARQELVRHRSDDDGRDAGDEYRDQLLQRAPQRQLARPASSGVRLRGLRLQLLHCIEIIKYP